MPKAANQSTNVVARSLIPRNNVASVVRDTTETSGTVANKVSLKHIV